MQVATVVRVLSAHVKKDGSQRSPSPPLPLAQKSAAETSEKNDHVLAAQQLLRNAKKFAVANPGTPTGVGPDAKPPPESPISVASTPEKASKDVGCAPAKVGNACIIWGLHFRMRICSAN